jgi:hypothetical protein
MRRVKVQAPLLSLCLLASSAWAQDPLKSLPQAYKLQFENDWVRVIRVHYAPHEKLPPHKHNENPAAYVYLNDGGPVIFKHLDLPYGAVTRPATKAASFRVYKGIKEIHEVENLSDLPSDFLRVEFKTEPVNEKSLRGRFYRETSTPGENFEKVQFENEQIRITRLICAPGKSLALSTNSTEPSLLVAVTSAALRISESSKSKPLTLGSGESFWIEAGREKHLTTANDAVELLRFDFKTKPMSKDKLEGDKKHQHSEK